MPPNPEVARFLFLIAHKKGHPQAAKQLALVKDGPTNQRAGTKAGTPSKYNQMIAEARKYEKGTGVTKDLNKALEFYLKAHELDKKSYYTPWNIGDLYLRIRKPKREVDKGIYWLEKAVSLGGVDAGWRLADFYATDKDPAVRDGKKAVKYAKTYADYQMKRYEKDNYEKKVRPFGPYATLAHAYARNGQFKEAEETMLLTIEMMKEGTFYDRYIDSYNKQLALFRNNQAWPPD